MIYTRVSKEEQNTQRQISELKKVPGFDVVKVFSENISGFTKAMEEREQLQRMLKFIVASDIKCIMISEVSRLGRNTHEVLNLIKQLEDQGVKIYIHNLGTTIGNDCPQSSMFTKLIVTIMADLARLESEQLSQRIRSGIRNRKSKGLATGRLIGTYETKERFLSKHKYIIKYLNQGRSYQEIAKLCETSPTTISKVKKVLKDMEAAA